MLITYLTATACAVAAICLGRSEYEKKALSVEEMNLYSDKVSKDRTFIFLSEKILGTTKTSLYVSFIVEYMSFLVELKKLYCAISTLFFLENSFIFSKTSDKSLPV